MSAVSIIRWSGVVSDELSTADLCSVLASVSDRAIQSTPIEGATQSGITDAAKLQYQRQPGETASLWRVQHITKVATWRRLVAKKRVSETQDLLAVVDGG